MLSRVVPALHIFDVKLNVHYYFFIFVENWIAGWMDGSTDGGWIGDLRNEGREA